MNPDFTDEQLAAIMTYIRNAWGNGAPPISTEAVARYRGSFAPRAPWTPEELLKIK
jgi:mono/diheme cytochrome c family protein